jgi:ribosomal protein L7Ae-like RNA K-turn-binding protein
VAGFERVGDAVRRGQAGLLLVALDGAEGGHRKLTALGRDLPWARVLTAAELGGAFGRERTVHAAIAGGPLCRRLLLDLARLVGLRAEAAVDLRASPGVNNGTDFAPAGPATQDGGTETHD